MSESGIPIPHSFNTSCLRRSCHSWCELNRNTVQLSKVEVVSCPAKKNILHSSMISFILNLRPGFVLAASDSPIISPSRSSPWTESELLETWEFNLLSMIDLNALFSLLSVFHIPRFSGVGRYLQRKRNY